MEQSPSKSVFWNRSGFLSEQDIRDTSGSFCFVFLYDVRIEILRFACAGVTQMQPKLVPFVLLQELHSFLREGQISNVAGFGGAFVRAFTGGNDERAVDFYSVVFKIRLFPFQPHNLAPAAAGNDQQVCDQLPFEWFRLQCFQYSGNCFRLEVIGVFFCCPGWGCL